MGLVLDSGALSVTPGRAGARLMPPEGGIAGQKARPTTRECTADTRAVVI